MADLEQLAELARDAERNAAPDFDQVVARARTQRRRRQGALAIAAAVVLVGGTAIASSLPDHARTSPPVTNHRKPAPPTLHRVTAEERIQQALSRGTTELIAAADADHVLIVREYCPRPQHCSWGSEITGAPESRKPANQVRRDPVSAGSAGFLDGLDARFLGLDGTTRAIGTDPGVPLANVGRPSPDAVFEMADDGAFTVYEPLRHRWWSYRLPVTAAPIRSLLLTDGGTIWMQQDDGARPAIISSSTDGGQTWTHHTLPRARSAHFGKVLWHAGTVGVPVYGADGVLRSIEVLEGDRWTELPPQGPLAGLAGTTSLAGTEPNIAGLTDGNLFVRDNDFRLWRAAPDSWTKWSVVSRDGPLTLTGSRDVLLGVGDDHQTVLRWTGTTWQVVG